MHEAFVEKLAERAASMTVGDPTDSKTRIGALVSAEQRDKVLRYIDYGREDGARLVTGGGKADVGGKGYFVEATVFDEVDSDMRIAQEEIFGPVLATLAFDDLDDAIDVANRTIYGLAAGVWTRDVGKAHRFAREVQAGTVWVNTYNRYDPASPFGGFKQSPGEVALHEYTQTKSVWVALD